MRPGREIDTRIAEEVFGYEVFVKQKILHERAPAGDRPLKKYSKEIEWAWEVVQKMNITLIPIEDGTWFAMTGKERGWSSPAEFMKFLAAGEFAEGGAALGQEVPLTICLAALNAIEHRRNTVSDARTKFEVFSAEGQLVN